LAVVANQDKVYVQPPRWRAFPIGCFDVVQMNPSILVDSNEIHVPVWPDIFENLHPVI
jgi:hypothetical protein